MGAELTGFSLSAESPGVFEDCRVSSRMRSTDDWSPRIASIPATWVKLAVYGLAGLMTLAMPVLAVVYGQWRIIAPGLVLALVLVPSSALQTPQWIFYRNLNYLREIRNDR